MAPAYRPTDRASSPDDGLNMIGEWGSIDASSANLNWPDDGFGPPKAAEES
jgi:hypothetical protein